MLDRRSDALLQLFTQAHETIIGKDRGNPQALYDRMMTSFGVSFRELCNDKAIAEFIRIVHTNLGAKVEHLDQAIQALCCNQVNVSFEQIRPVLPKLAKGLQSAYRNIRVETNRGPRQVEISKIYIPPKLRYRDTPLNAVRISAATRELPEVLQKALLSKSGPLAKLAEGQTSQLKYNELKQTFSRVVVLGDPGGGKSTLCQNMCYDLAKQSALVLQSGDASVDGQLQKFPFRIILRLFEKARTTEPQLSPFEYLIRDLVAHVGGARSEMETSVRYLLTNGRAVIAFDGLDEILVSAQRRDFVDLVEAFCEQYPLCPVLITSRLVGYDDAPLSNDFEEIVLEHFDREEVSAYMKKFMMVVAAKKAEEALEASRKFLFQTERNAADLRRNPLMLGLMAWIFNSREDVPSNRPEIYRECAILMFERWDSERHINPEIPYDFDRLQLFSHLAALIFESSELRAGVDEGWLQKQIQTYFERIYENRAMAYLASNKLVKFMCGRAWVMSEVGDKTYTFTHQTFLEYFFARHIDDTNDTAERLLNTIIPKIKNREWDVVSHLALQIKTHRNLRKQEEAIKLLRNELQVEQISAEQNAIVSFAARALEYLPGPEFGIEGPRARNY